MKRLLMEAALKKYEGDLAVAQANLDIYLGNPVGIGEHPDVMEEVTKLVMRIHDAQGCIDVIINTWKEEKNYASLKNNGDGNEGNPSYEMEIPRKEN